MLSFKSFGIATIIFALSASVFAEVKNAQPREYDEMAEELLGTRQSELGIENGTDVTGLTIQTAEGKDLSLDTLFADEPLMLIFYRGGWCPFCNAQIRELAQRYSEFEEVGVEIAVISVDKPDASTLTKSAYNVPFPVLSDQDLIAHEAFNVVFEVSKEEAKQIMERRGRDLTEWSGRDHLSYAVASSFLIGTDGEVKWSTVVEDFRSRPTPEQLLEAIEN